MGQKRHFDDSNVEKSPKSKASRFNAHTVRKLQAAINDDPEVDLVSRMPMDYSSRLIEMRDSEKNSSGKQYKRAKFSSHC